jgi:Bifunctional DNA primase/polymerase, N-terminal
MKMVSVMSDTPLNVALGHLGRFPTDYLFPLAKLSKFPPLLKKNLSDNCSNDPAQIRAWAKQFAGCNFGIALRRSRLIVADIDTSKGKPGRATFELLDMVDGWPKTSCVKTPSDGFHLYYRGQHVMKVNGFGPAVDSPNYVVCPGMKVKDGKSYRYTNLRARAEAPTWFYEMLAPKERAANAAETVVELDQPHHIAWAVDYLLHDAPLAVEGEGGEFRTMLTAMSLRDNGISEEMARELILEHYNERCSPPWDLEGLTQKIANGYAYASLRPIGGGTAQADFADDDPGEITPMGPTLVTIHGKTFPVVRDRRPRPRKKKGHANAT